MTAQIKPICGLERVKLADAVPLRTPFSLFVFPTTYCNFKCNYCGHSLGLFKMKEKYDFKPENMSLELYKKIIDQIKMFPDKLKMLSLTGHGEPLLNKELPKMIELAKQANITERIEIITNASLLSNEMSRRLITSGLDTIRISLQGLSSEKYQEVSGCQLDFDKFVNNIKYFYQNKKQCNVYIKIMDVALKEGDVDKFYNLFSDICDRMYIEKCKPVYDGVHYSGDLLVKSDRYGRVHEKRDVCPLPFFMLGIFPNGDVEPCDTIYKPVVLGNITEDTLYNMWNGEKLKEFQIMHLEKQRGNNSKCAVCCAPDDVAHPEDNLDDSTEDIISRLSKSKGQQ